MAGSGENGVYYAVIGAVLDGDGVPVSGLHELDSDRTGGGFGRPDISKCRDEPGWLVAYDDQSGYVHVVRMDESGRPTGDDWTIGEGHRRDAEPVLVSVCGLTTVIWYASGGFRIRTFNWPDVESGMAETIFLTPPSYREYPRHSAVRYRDRIIMAYIDGEHINTFAVDPWTGLILSGTHAAGLSDAEHHWPSLAPAEEKGYIGVCYNTIDAEPGLREGAVFRLVDSDGRPFGAGLRVEGVTEVYTTNVGLCDVSWSGSEFLMTYMRQGAIEDPRWGLWIQRIRPLF
jgi:hypothetical protein